MAPTVAPYRFTRGHQLSTLLILYLAQLGTGMILAMDAFELGFIDMGVDLGSGQVGMAEEFLDDPQIRPSG